MKKTLTPLTGATLIMFLEGRNLAAHQLRITPIFSSVPFVYELFTLQT